MHATSVALASSLALVLCACAGAGPSAHVPTHAALPLPSASAPQPPPAPGAPPPDAQKAATATEEPEDVVPAVDPLAAQALLAKTGDAGGNAPLGLRFEIVEFGPDAPWVMAVVNRGTEAVSVAFDPRLLRLELEPPKPAEPKPGARVAKPKKTLACALPEEIVPRTAEEPMLVDLEPGEGVVENFDPRLYCAPGSSAAAIVPGTRVSAHFGWPVKTKAQWRNGKREQVAIAQLEPFLALPMETAGSQPARAPAVQVRSEARVKELAGTPFTLGDDYVSHVPEPGEAALEGPLTLAFIAGSDATNAAAATVTLALGNRGARPLDVYFRRELVSFEVVGPDRTATCDPKPDRRAPDRQAFVSLRPGHPLLETSRLIELCPRRTFARPGLYWVHARFDATVDGSQYGLKAFRGRVVSRGPAQVRIRKGELPFLGRRAVERIHVGR